MRLHELSFTLNMFFFTEFQVDQLVCDEKVLHVANIFCELMDKYQNNLDIALMVISVIKTLTEDGTSPCSYNLLKSQLHSFLSFHTFLSLNI